MHVYLNLIGTTFENELALKILSNISSPESLALEAVTELRAAAGSRRFEQQVQVNGANVHQRDYQGMVTHFDSIWRGLYKQGVIRSRAPGKRHDGGALLVQEGDLDDSVNEVQDGAHPEQSDEVYWVGGKGKAS